MTLALIQHIRDEPFSDRIENSDQVAKLKMSVIMEVKIYYEWCMNGVIFINFNSKILPRSSKNIIHFSNADLCLTENSVDTLFLSSNVSY